MGEIRLQIDVAFPAELSRCEWPGRWLLAWEINLAVIVQSEPALLKQEAQKGQDTFSPRTHGLSAGHLHFINLASESLFIIHFPDCIARGCAATSPSFPSPEFCFWSHFLFFENYFSSQTTGRCSQREKHSGQRTAWSIKALKQAALLFQLLSFS